jgi:hypothetical protein
MLFRESSFFCQKTILPFLPPKDLHPTEAVLDIDDYLGKFQVFCEIFFKVNKFKRPAIQRSSGANL